MKESPAASGLVESAAMRFWCALLVGFSVAVLPLAQVPAHADTDEVELLGDLTREEIEEVAPGWVEEQVRVEVDPEAATRLATVGAGAEVVIYLGTWCSDSRHEMSRLWRHLDEVGGLVPWSIRYVGIAEDHDERPADLVAAADLRYLPTFVVLEDGVERGRIVESSPGTVENDLASLLAGEVEGLLSGRDDL